MKLCLRKIFVTYYVFYNRNTRGTEKIGSIKIYLDFMFIDFLVVTQIPFVYTYMHNIYIYL